VVARARSRSFATLRMTTHKEKARRVAGLLEVALQGFARSIQMCLKSSWA
jgi:hypothetical protein